MFNRLQVDLKLSIRIAKGILATLSPACLLLSDDLLGVYREMVPKNRYYPVSSSCVWQKGLGRGQRSEWAD